MIYTYLTGLLMLLTSFGCSREQKPRNLRSPQPLKTFLLTDDPVRDCRVSGPAKNTLMPKLSLSSQSTDAAGWLSRQIPSYLTPVAQRSEHTLSGGPSRHFTFSLRSGAIPLCEFLTRVHYRNSSYFSDLPDHISWPDSSPADLFWEDADKNLTLFKEQGTIAFRSVHQKRKCIFLDQNTWLPAWQYRYTDQKSRPWILLLSGSRILKHYPVSVPLTAELEIYRENPDSKKLVKVRIPGMQNNSHLCSDMFLTKVDTALLPAVNNMSALQEHSGISFEAGSVFANASLTGQFFRNLGSQNWFGTQVLLYLSENGGPAYYPPFISGTSFSLPTIVLPRSGSGLKNLRLDSDVLIHEYSHHLVFKTARDLAKRSVFAIHDGFADFFAYMLNEDPCLGESICSENSPLCRPSGCLRSARNNLTLPDLPPVDSLPRYQHYHHSELISAALWDFRNESGISFETGARWALQAVEYLSASADFDNLVLALELAREDLFSHKHSCLLQNILERRGFTVRNNPSHCTL